MSETVPIRDFRAADVPQVANLWQKCFRKSYKLPSPAVQQYFQEILLDHPWFDPHLAPLVAEKNGEIIGFLGRMARPMTFQGQPIHCAIATQLMVDPDRRAGFTALELVRALQGGPQELCYSDGANEQSLRIWQRSGGVASRLLSFEWTRILRPLQMHSISLRSHWQRLPWARLGHDPAGLVDGMVAGLFPRLRHKPTADLLCVPATGAGQILTLMKQLCQGVALFPSYTEPSFNWLLRKTSEAREFGDLRSLIVLDKQQQPVGWFIYFARRGEIAHVLQAGALPPHGLRVLQALFYDAWQQGAAAVSGQLDPLLLTELSNSHCHFRCSNLGVLVHARDPELLNAIQSGNAFLSRLEGEWWMRFGIDRNADW